MASAPVMKELTVSLCKSVDWFLYDTSSRQCCVVMEIRLKLHCQVVVTHVPTLPLEVEEKEEMKNLLKCGKFPLINGRWQSFHISEK